MTQFITITIEGVDEQLAAFHRMADATAEQREEVEAFGDSYLETLRDATPVGRGEDPGKTRDAYQNDDQSYSATQAEYNITNDAVAIKYITEGRGPVVATGRALRFVIDGQVFFRKRVKAARANPFDERVRGQMRSQAQGLAERIAARIVRNYGR